MNVAIKNGEVGQLAGFCRPSKAVVVVERVVGGTAYVRFIDGSGHGSYSVYAVRALPVMLK